MKHTLTFLFLSAVAALADPLSDADRAAAARSLGMAPELLRTETVGRREVEWFEHDADPAWGGASIKSQLAVAKPVGGDAQGAGLLVVLHARDGGRPDGGVITRARAIDDKGNVYAAPDGFYVLALDCMHGMNSVEQRNPDFWWGASDRFRGPVKEDVPRYLRGPTPTEKRMLDSVEWAIRRYGIDRDRVYLAGNSMGGQGALAIGLPHGEIFAAIHANVPATVWLPAARMGFLEPDGSPMPPPKTPSPLADPPVLIDWSGSNDAWSRDHELLWDGLRARRMALIGLWGDYGHEGSIEKAREKNDLVGSFDMFSVTRDMPYPAFSGATCDDRSPWPFSVYRPQFNTWGGYAGDVKSAEMRVAEGAPASGQINAFFRWKALADDKGGVVMELWIESPETLGTKQFAVPETATADVTLRRVRALRVVPGDRYEWAFGVQKGTVAVSPDGLLTIPGLTLSRSHERLLVRPVSQNVPFSRGHARAASQE